MADTVAKLVLEYDPRKESRAWLIKITGEEKEHWMPYSCITAYLPATKEISIKVWILKQKNIKFKLNNGK